MGIIVAEKFDRDAERKLLKEWFATTRFDVPSKGVPTLEPEDDDEGEEADVKSRAASIAFKAITPGGRVGDPSSHNYSPRRNWVEKRGGLPRYIRMVRNALVREGHSESRATALAVAAMKRWASGRGNVTAKVRAAAAAALAQWERMKAA